MVLNTRFNENEPIVDTPEQALDCFARTDMDALCLGRSGLYPSYQVRLGHRDRFRFKQVGHGQREDLEPECIGTLTGSRSVLVHESLPQDDPPQRQPDITRAREALGWGRWERWCGRICPRCRSLWCACLFAALWYQFQIAHPVKDNDPKV